MRAVSRVRHPNKRRCLMLCIDKEKSGFECKKPIKEIRSHEKIFNKKGQYIRTIEETYYEAVYVKEVVK
ncbi:hypothetical protein BN997_01102 [Oceanobacillus oncorhynchi]|uniref:Uncharacterized protein n=1 Tax=Oceanobacillus oncorhynchi TaxID=545501 RepID=A0A0A1MNE1_9BACI|nr:hypothetical protein BN997_01102 [Oceanobacillus oncorhynchi]